MKHLIKFSGEMFTSKDGLTAEGEVLFNDIVALKHLCYIVVGGGNRVRGRDSFLDRNASDELGVISTIMNALILKEKFRQAEMECEVFSHFCGIGSLYKPNSAMDSFNAGKIIILAGGLGSVGYISTDLSAVIKALELKVDFLLKVTKVDGVYDKDPAEPDAQLLKRISYVEIIEKKLAIMDYSAICIAKENKLPIRIISAANYKNIFNVDKDIDCGSLIY